MRLAARFTFINIAGNKASHQLHQTNCSSQAYGPMKTTSLLLALAFVFYPVESAAQQYDSNGISMRGSVSRKVLMSPSEQAAISSDNDLAAQLIRSGDELIILRLQGAQPEASIISVRLMLRTNAAYELCARLASSINAPSIIAQVANIRATGAWVVPGAIESVRAARSPITLSNESNLLASGSRISRGAASSPNNVIEVELRIKVIPGDAAAWSSDVTIEIIAK